MNNIVFIKLKFNNLKSMEAKKKRIDLTLKQKIEILTKLDSKPKPSYRQISAEYGCSIGVITNILKNKEDIQKLYIENSSDKRHRLIRNCDNEELNNIVFEFFKACRAKGIPVSGPMIQQRAKQIAEALGNENFQASNGWLEKFRLRHNIEFKVKLVNFYIG